jgi:hypothetical protein
MALTVVVCAACTIEPPTPVQAGELCGSGTVAGTAYTVDPTGTELAITVARGVGGACGLFHSHAVRALAARMTYNLDATGAGDVVIEVPANNLDPDPPELREKLLPEGENEPLSDNDRGSIRGSVLDEVLAVDHPVLTFTLGGLSAISGSGNATLTSDFAGAKSDVPVVYTVTPDGDAFIVAGTATIDGTAHGVPRNPLGGCVNPNLGLHFTVRLVPGAGSCTAVDGGPVFTPQFYPDITCSPDADYGTLYNDVVGPRCLGCHGDVLRIGATSPLIRWEDWRTSTIRFQEGPLYLEADDYIHRQPGQGLAMPPADQATPLSAAELAQMEAWIADGARKDRCEGAVPPRTFGLGPDGTAVDPQTEPTGLECEGANLASVQDILVNNCMFCHGGGDVNAPISGTPTSIDRLATSTHPFYIDSVNQKLGFWEAGLARVKDKSMPTYDAMIPDEQVDAFERWVRCGLAP